MFINFLFFKYKPIILPILVVIVIKAYLFIWSGYNFNFLSNQLADWLDVWSRWDSNVYKDIATFGYSNPGYLAIDHWSFLSHFPPLYPFIMYLIFLLGVTSPIAGISVSIISIIGASILLYKLVLIEFKDENVALFSVLFLNFYPTSYFTMSVYSESLFIFLVIASFYYLRREKFLFSGLCVAGAILTRNVGVVLLPVYCLSFLPKPENQFKTSLFMVASCLRDNYLSTY